MQDNQPRKDSLASAKITILSWIAGPFEQEGKIQPGGPSVRW
jgi:hypothetical protein